ncbi:MAG: cation transporter, partial [Methylobacter sp.]|nr:cation transporter [Methylobacter sp.]
EDDESLQEQSRPLSRGEVQRLLERYLADFKLTIDDFRIHYLDGQIEVEVILPFAVSESPERFAAIKKQCRLMSVDIKKIDNVFLFFKV